VSRRDDQRLEDVLAAINAIEAHLKRGDLRDDLVYDAVRARLIEIGEPIKGISPELLVEEVSIPWAQVAGMRDRLAHRYYDLSRAIVQATVDDDLPELASAARRMKARTTSG
jgi:uncharacterized protein with HEPN domain